MFGLTLTTVLFVSAKALSTLQAEDQLRVRGKRQPGSFAGFLPSNLDFSGCCCRKGVPRECLKMCQVIFGDPPSPVPKICNTYHEVYLQCFETNQEGPAPQDANCTCKRQSGHCPVDVYPIGSLACNNQVKHECHTHCSCHLDGVTKCCPSTCLAKDTGLVGANICVEPHALNRSLSLCEQKRREVIDALIKTQVKVYSLDTLGVWLPQCVPHNEDSPPPVLSFVRTQCVKASNSCFCVDPESGTEIPRTRFNLNSVNLNCSNIRGCVAKRLFMLGKYGQNTTADLTSPSCGLPDCQPDDPTRYEPLQCNKCKQTMQECYCADETTGSELDRTRHTPPENITSLNCTDIGETLCEREKALILHFHSFLDPEELKEKIADGSVWVPNCIVSPKRSHHQLQCNSQRGLCWCTLDNGRPIVDTISPPGAHVILDKCSMYTPSKCDVEVANVAHSVRVLFGLLNATQSVYQRFTFERRRSPFIPRCVANRTHSFERQQLTWRLGNSFSEQFCVNPQTGAEEEGSRLGAGEHRLLSEEERICPLRRSRCQTDVFYLLRRLQYEMSKQQQANPHYINRFTTDKFIPACQSNKVQETGGFVARQCGRSNGTCWCVFPDGVAVPGTRHPNTTTRNCGRYHDLCRLHGPLRGGVSFEALQSAKAQCSSKEVCRASEVLIGVGICDAVEENRNCYIYGRTVAHGSTVIMTAPCQICHCENGSVAKCSKLESDACQSDDSCRVFRMTSWTDVSSGTRHRINCRDCNCTRGLLTCGERIVGCTDATYDPCTPTFISREERTAVCAPNGQTYASAEIAKLCGGFSKVTFGRCDERTSICVNSSALCGPGKKCVPFPRVCIVPPCPQHVCVEENVLCGPSSSGGQVCGDDGVTYESMCHLLASNTHLAYNGDCRQECQSTKVCGVNGLTYKSVCHANTRLIAVDYFGPCSARCADVIGKCRIIQSICSQETKSASGCCSFCGGALTLNIRKSLSAALEISNTAPAANDVISLLTALQSHLNTTNIRQCTVTGQLNNLGHLEVEVRAVHSMYGHVCGAAAADIVKGVNSGLLQQQLPSMAAVRSAVNRPSTSGSGCLRFGATEIFTMAIAAMITFLFGF